MVRDCEDQYKDDGDDALSASDEDEGFDTFETESIAQITLENLSGVIDKLYRLSFKIRNPATRIGFSKASHYREVDHETGVDLIQQFEAADHRHLNEVVASLRRVLSEECADDFLVRRLARANTLRRQQIKKWKNHSTKMKSNQTQK